MKNVNLKEIIHFTDKVSVVVVSTAVIAIIVGSIMLFFPKIERTNKVELDYTINNDSLKVQLNDSTFTYFKIDPTQINKINQNNQKLFGEIKDLVNNYEERHDALLTESKKREDFISYAAAIFAFIISIASFFGFKSINEMKKAAIESAEIEAKRVSDEKSNIVAKKVASDITNDYINKILKKEVVQVSKETVKNELSKIDERITTLENNTSNDDVNEIGGNNNVIDENQSKPFNDSQI